MAESLTLQNLNLKETKIGSAEELANLANDAESPPNSEATDSAIGKSSQDVSSEDEQSVIPDESSRLVESERVVDFGDQNLLTVPKRNLSGSVDLEGGNTMTANKETSKMTSQELEKYYDSKITYITEQGMYHGKWALVCNTDAVREAMRHRKP